jgi:dienelactone hydrolase
MLRVAAVCAVIALAGCWIILPVPQLPTASGPYDVGTTVFRWTMPTRAESATVTAADRRAAVVQAWYPAVPRQRPASVPYLDGLGRLPERVSGIPRAMFSRFDRIDTHADSGAAVASGSAPWPVVIFSPGYGASRAFYATLVSDLASRGFIVLAMDHPYESAVTQLPDGRIVTPIERFLPGDTNRVQYMVRQTAERSADMRAVLDAISLPTHDGPFGALVEHMDRSRIAAVGHSFGGATAVATAAADPRLSAAANLDGTLYGALPDQPLTQPVLLIESDRAETKHGRLFLDGHARLFANLRGGGARCQIERANHYSFTDASLLLSPPWRWLASLFVGGSRGTPETVRLTNDLLVAFLRDTVSEVATGCPGGTVH